MNDPKTVLVANACEALDMTSGEIADMLRRDAARLLMRASVELIEDSDVTAEKQIEQAQRRLATADRFEFVWGAMTPDDDAHPDDEIVESEKAWAQEREEREGGERASEPIRNGGDSPHELDSTPAARSETVADPAPADPDWPYERTS
jgi:hypothetical protein